MCCGIRRTRLPRVLCAHKMTFFFVFKKKKKYVQVESSHSYALIYSFGGGVILGRHSRNPETDANQNTGGKKYTKSTPAKFRRQQDSETKA